LCYYQGIRRCFTKAFGLQTLLLSHLLHQPLHLAHLALEEAVDANLATVGVEGDGGEEKIPAVEKQPQGYATLEPKAKNLYHIFGIRRVILGHLLS